MEKLGGQFVPSIFSGSWLVKIKNRQPSLVARMRFRIIADKLVCFLLIEDEKPVGLMHVRLLGKRGQINENVVQVWASRLRTQQPRRLLGKTFYVSPKLLSTWSPNHEIGNWSVVSHRERH